jgi:uncharacterized membrane protein YhaH (DUF805 family)
MFEPRQIDPEDRLNRRQRWVVVAMNLLLLAELTLGMYWGQQDPENMSAVFLRIFVPSAAMTIVAARLMLRRLRNRIVE